METSWAHPTARPSRAQMILPGGLKLQNPFFFVETRVEFAIIHISINHRGEDPGSSPTESDRLSDGRERLIYVEFHPLNLSRDLY